MDFTRAGGITHEPRRVNNCSAYPFANDRWSEEVAQDLRTRLGQQTTPRERAAGLVLGSGGLPYILAHIEVSRLVVADLHEEVIKKTLWRVQRLGDHDSWSDYMAETQNLLDTLDAFRLDNEFAKAERGGLLGDFAVTRAALAATEISGAQGDIQDTAPDLADQMRNRGVQVTFVNLTNAANYIRPEDNLPTDERRGIIGAAIGTLPLASDAVIVDSSYGLTPELYSVTNYPGVRTE